MSVRAIKPIIILILVIAALPSCGSAPVVLGDEKSDNFQAMSVAVIRRHQVDMEGRAVAITGTYFSPIPSEIEKEKDAILIKTEFGDVAVMMPPGKYQSALSAMKKNTPVTVFGYVTSMTLPGKKKILLAIEVK